MTDSQPTSGVLLCAGACLLFLHCATQDSETAEARSLDGSGSSGAAELPGTGASGQNIPLDHDLGRGGAPGTAGTLSPGRRVYVPGGTFAMGRGSDTDACPADLSCAPHESPEHVAEVSSFELDSYEVTVARFRLFVDVYTERDFASDAGGLWSIPDSGVGPEFSKTLPATTEQLKDELACSASATWSDEPHDRENFPINCVSWSVATAFCITVGGRLPTEAEWEFAAAGGNENRLYPWGEEAPDERRASFFPGVLHSVGSYPGGDGRFGNSDLAGNVWEWVYDWLDTGWYAGAGMDCRDCARVTGGTHRVLRGGAYSYEEATLRAATRSGYEPDKRDDAIGFRCAYPANE